MISQDYEESEGIITFHDDIEKHHEDYDAQGLDNLYREEERHFWFLARKEFIFQQMIDYVNVSSRVIEIGAGTGNVSRYLKQKGYADIAVGEMHRNGLRYAKSYGIEECYQFDLLRTPFEDEFDGVCLFDVLEHIEEDGEALSNAHRMLKTNGFVVLTVPAHKWLWNRDDVIAGHKRRYTKRELASKLETVGFEVEYARYFFITITPLLYLRRLLRQDKGAPARKAERLSDISMNPVLSKVLYYVSKVENRLNSFLPNWFGGSLMVIGRKH